MPSSDIYHIKIIVLSLIFVSVNKSRFYKAKLK